MESEWVARCLEELVHQWCGERDTHCLAVVQGRVVEGAPHPRIHHRAPVGSGSPPSSAKRRVRNLADLLTVGAASEKQCRVPAEVRAEAIAL
jgi:hypothetical protein